MWEDEICDGVQTCAGVFLGEVIFVTLNVGGGGRILLVGIACKAFQTEGVIFQVLLEDISE